MSGYIFSHETLIRLAVFMVLGFVFWGLSLRFPMQGFALQKVQRFDGIFIFIALLLAGLAEEFLAPFVVLCVQAIHQVWEAVPFDDVSTSRDEISNALGRDDVSGNDRNLRIERSDEFERLNHLLLMAVSGINDKDIYSCFDQTFCFCLYITIDANRGRNS